MATQKLLGSTQACAILGIHRATLGQWMDKGWIKPLERLPGGYLFTRAEVERAKAARLAAVPSDEVAS